MAMPTVEMRALLEAGVHFGHQKHRWNPKMAPFIFGHRNKVHILDLSQTVPMFQRALETVRSTVAGGGRVLFVGTKRQASSIIADAAKRSGQYYVNHRWLGGMLTNWQTISNSIKQLKELDALLGKAETGLTKKETLQATRRRDKLELSLGGIRDMGGLPDVIFVIDTNRETTALLEAKRLGIPVVAVIDSNCSPDGIDFPIPGNDDATRAIKLYCDLMADTILDGIKAELASQGVDLGAVEAPVEEVVAEAAAEEAPAAEAAAEEAPAVEAAAEEAPAVEAAAEEAPVAEVAAEEAPAEEAPAKKAPAKKAPAKKAAAKKAPAKKAADK